MFYCAINSHALTLKNAPFTEAFTMTVEAAAGISDRYPCQVYRRLSDGAIAYRHYSNDGVRWIDYCYFSDDDTVQTNTEGYMFSASGEYLEDCNTITRPGLCKKVITPTMPNSPGFYAYILVLLYKGGGMTNITQVAFPYNSKDAIKCRYSSNGEWSEWF